MNVAPPIIKLCGNKTLKAVTNLEPHVPEWLGFIFYSRSPRYFQQDPSVLAPLQNIKVGVFVNESHHVILATAKKARLDYVQLHGSESPEECEKIANEVAVIKAFGIDNSFNFNQLTNYKQIVSHFLFDTLSHSYGGSGMKYDRSILKNYKLSIPFFMSGGIDLEEALLLLQSPLPQMKGIDINSRFEDEKGNKKVALIHQLMLAKKSIHEL